MLRHVKSFYRYMQLPSEAKREAKKDHRTGLYSDPGPQRVIEEGIAWLGRAQDCSASRDGGVARDFSLVKGWATSYPETTGYIIPTMIDYGLQSGEQEPLQRAEKMLDWLQDIQLQDGGFQGGKIDATPVVPVTFNTGQILIGLAAGVKQFGRYQEATEKAAQWLVDSLDDDGCWRKHPTPFAAAGEKAYETHVAWGLFEADRVMPGRGFGEAGMKQVEWALTKQHENGWLDDCCLVYPVKPLTHTLGYALRGIIEAYRWSEAPHLLQAAIRTADGLLTALRDDGYLPGRLDSQWQPGGDYVCLTGSVQIANNWLDLYLMTGDKKYRDAGFLANQFVRKTIDVNGADATRGAVKGSFPVGGDYGTYEYLNWAVKFCIDSNMNEMRIRQNEGLS
ncbi:MAG: hypothetical protein R3E62_13100 [Pseudomonadales bacterium]